MLLLVVVVSFISAFSMSLFHSSSVCLRVACSTAFHIQVFRIFVVVVWFLTLFLMFILYFAAARAA